MNDPCQWWETALCIMQKELWSWFPLWIELSLYVTTWIAKTQDTLQKWLWIQSAQALRGICANLTTIHHCKVSIRIFINFANIAWGFMTISWSEVCLDSKKPCNVIFPFKVNAKLMQLHCWAIVIRYILAPKYDVNVIETKQITLVHTKRHGLSLDYSNPQALSLFVVYFQNAHGLWQSP